MEVKRHWLGQQWYLPGAAGNDINKVSVKLPWHTRAYQSVFQTNVPDIRLKYRHETLAEELRMICADWSTLNFDSAPVHPTGDSIAAKAMSVSKNTS
jgi:AMP deaminase